jgi:hypothetical protein
MLESLQRALKQLFTPSQTDCMHVHSPSRNGNSQLENINHAPKPLTIEAWSILARQLQLLIQSSQSS